MLRVIVDSREQQNKHILAEVGRCNINYVVRALSFGDYSFELDGKSYETEIAIERKGSLSELAGNFTRGRKKFMREFERAKKFNTRMYLFVEDSSYEDIKNWNYRSSFTPTAYFERLEFWCYSYGLKLEFVDRNDFCDRMMKVFASYLREGGENR